MARARNIKPGFFQNDELGELDPLARLAFIGMWTIADFKGCIEYRPKMLKVQLLPYDECDIELITNNLDKARFIRFYSVQGKRYIKIVNFEKHQNPHKNEREAGSLIPDITEQDEESNNNNELTQDGTKPDLIGTAQADSLLLIPSTLIPSTLKPDTSKKPSAEYSAEFELAWAAYPARPGANKKESFKAWTARVKAGADQNAMIEGATRYASYCMAQGVDPQFIKQPATFFGPGDHYLSDWTAQAPQRKTPSLDNFAAKDYGTGVNPL